MLVIIEVKTIKEKIGCIGAFSIINKKKQSLENNYRKRKKKEDINFKRSGLLMDEIDGLTSNQESSGVDELISIIDKKTEKNKMPIICTCNSVSNRKISKLMKRGLCIRIANPSKRNLLDLISRIGNEDKIPINLNSLHVLAKYVNDYRKLINLMYQIKISLKNKTENEIYTIDKNYVLKHYLGIEEKEYEKNNRFLFSYK